MSVDDHKKATGVLWRCSCWATRCCVVPPGNHNISYLAATLAFSCDMSAAPGAPPGAARSGAGGAAMSGPRGMPPAATATPAACLLRSSCFLASTLRFVASSIAANCDMEEKYVDVVGCHGRRMSEYASWPRVGCFEFSETVSV